jgi:threonine aldolase
MTEIIDLRSDTVTRPTAAMLQAMMHAKVGDDVLGDDPTVKALERETAAYFGAEAALFCPSGTMANQIAIQLHTRPGDEVICHEYSHIYLYEGGGIMANAHCSVRLLPGERGLLNANQVEQAINAKDIHATRSRLVALENTCNKGGGSCYRFSDLEEIGKVARKHEMRYHLDGARLWNALVTTGDNPKKYGPLFDTISICLSKGLGCPVGSLLLGTAENMEEARRIRKRMGGGMRQAGFLAAAGLYAMEHHIARLAEDHAKAKALAQALSERAYVESVEPVETNIVIFKLADRMPQEAFIQRMKEHGVLLSAMGPGKVRMVTHLDISDGMVERVMKMISEVED